MSPHDVVWRLLKNEFSFPTDDDDDEEEKPFFDDEFKAYMKEFLATRSEDEQYTAHVLDAGPHWTLNDRQKKVVEAALNVPDTHPNHNWGKSHYMREESHDMFGHFRHLFDHNSYQVPDHEYDRAVAVINNYAKEIDTHMSNPNADMSEEFMDDVTNPEHPWTKAVEGYDGPLSVEADDWQTKNTGEPMDIAFQLLKEDDRDEMIADAEPWETHLCKHCGTSIYHHLQQGEGDGSHPPQEVWSNEVDEGGNCSSPSGFCEPGESLGRTGRWALDATPESHPNRVVVNGKWVDVNDWTDEHTAELAANRNPEGSPIVNWNDTWDWNKDIQTGEPMDIAFQLLKAPDDFDKIQDDIERSKNEGRRSFPEGRKKGRSMGSGSTEEEHEPRERPNARNRGPSFEDTEALYDSLELHPGSRGHETNIIQSDAGPRGRPPEFGTFMPIEDNEWIFEEEAEDISTEPALDELKPAFGPDNRIQNVALQRVMDKEYTNEVPTFSQVPYNPLTGFTRSEPMDLAWRLLKEKEVVDDSKRFAAPNYKGSFYFDRETQTYRPLKDKPAE